LVETEVVGAAPGDALLAVKTPPGSADAVAIAIDDADLAGVVGTVAGDDTIVVLLRDAEARDRLLELLEGGG
ncbi:MAG: arginine repressor, partial [Gemmatimonadota bacterium]